MVKSSTLSNERKNKWALPSGALERHFGPICSLAPDGSVHLFSLIRQSRRFYIIYQKIKEIGLCHRKLCRFENTPGHPL